MFPREIISCWLVYSGGTRRLFWFPVPATHVTIRKCRTQVTEWCIFPSCWKNTGQRTCRRRGLPCGPEQREGREQGDGAEFFPSFTVQHLLLSGKVRGSINSPQYLLYEAKHLKKGKDIQIPPWDDVWLTWEKNAHFVITIYFQSIISPSPKKGAYSILMASIQEGVNKFECY